MPEKMTMKDKVLGIIARRGAAGPTPLMQGSKATADALKVIVRELEQEGRIKSWPYQSRSGQTAIYTLPDAKDPRTKEMLEAKLPKPEKKAAPAKAPATEPPSRRTPPVAAPAIKPALSYGSSPVASAITDLEFRRDKIDQAIAILRALSA